MAWEKILYQTRAGIIDGETAARQRCCTARTYVLEQTLRCSSYVPSLPSLLSLIPGMQARHRMLERIVHRLEMGVSFFECSGCEPGPDIHISSDASLFWYSIEVWGSAYEDNYRSVSIAFVNELLNLVMPLNIYLFLT